GGRRGQLRARGGPLLLQARNVGRSFAHSVKSPQAGAPRAHPDRPRKNLRPRVRSPRIWSLEGCGMTASPQDGPALLGPARAGSREALGQVIEAFRPYLLLVAREEQDPAFQGKGGASDLVEETFLEAVRDFDRFHGTTAEELLAWLRKLLLNNVADF